MAYSDETIIAAIVSNGTYREAIASLGMSTRHFYKRLQDTGLQAKLKSAREKMLTEALTKLQIGTAEAVDVLRELMLDSNVNPSTRKSAATSFLQTSLQFTEQLDILHRLERLESNAARNN